MVRTWAARWRLQGGGFVYHGQRSVGAEESREQSERNRRMTGIQGANAGAGGGLGHGFESREQGTDGLWNQVNLSRNETLGQRGWR